MISGADVLLDVKLLAQFTQEVGGKSRVSIGDDLSRKTIVGEYVSKVELGYSWSIDFFSAGDKQCCFGAVVVGDGEYCSDFSPFPYPDSIPDQLPSPDRPPRLLSMTDRTPKTSIPKILRRYPYRFLRLCLSIRHVTLDPH